MPYSCAFLNARFMNNVGVMARTCALMNCDTLYYSPELEVHKDNAEIKNPIKICENSNNRHVLKKYSRGYNEDINMKFLADEKSIIENFDNFINGSKTIIVFLESPDYNIKTKIHNIFELIKEKTENNILFVVGGERSGEEGIPSRVITNYMLKFPERSFVATIPAKFCEHGKGHTSGNVNAMLSVVIGSWISSQM